MKTLKLKVMFALGALIICTFSISDAALTGMAGVTPGSKFEKENSDIRHDLGNINMQKDRIQFLDAKYKADKKAGNKVAMLADQKELEKAKADLKKHKAYLVADKRDLMKDHNLAISEQKKEIRKDRSNVSANRRKLDKELAKGNETAAQECVSKIVRHQNDLKNDKTALHNARTDRNENILAVNKDIKKSQGQPAAVLTAENTVAHVDNWISK